jgi:hypothetical protein
MSIPDDPLNAMLWDVIAGWKHPGRYSMCDRNANSKQGSRR